MQRVGLRSIYLILWNARVGKIRINGKCIFNTFEVFVFDQFFHFSAIKLENRAVFSEP